MSGVFILPPSSGILTEKLDYLLRETSSEYIILTHQSGSVITEVGELYSGDSSLFAALGAALYSSAMSLANMLGDNQLEYQIHKGERINMYLYAVGKDSLLIFVTSALDNQIAALMHRMPFWVADLEEALLTLGGTQTISTHSRLSN
jgi:predicted regulator of Ras-like GTPase activity (Roadblock/LC7/MglB family)